MATPGNGPITAKAFDAFVKPGRDAVANAAKSKAELQTAGRDVKKDQTSSKTMQVLLEQTKQLVLNARDESSMQKAVAALEQKKLALAKEYGKVQRTNNAELTEHYKKHLELADAQLQHMKQTLGLERRRVQMQREFTKIQTRSVTATTKQAQATAAETEQQKRLGRELRRTTEEVKARVQIEKQSVAANKSIEEAQKSLRKAKPQKAKAFADTDDVPKPPRNTQQVHDDSEPETRQRDGILSKALGGAGTFLAGLSGYELLKSGLTGVSNASDIATESQYHFGVSMDRLDKSFSGYASRAYSVIGMNARLGLSYARMGMSAEEAAEVVPKLLTGSGTALKAFQEGNVARIEAMAKAAGAFSRQTGVSLEDAIQLQNNLIAVQGKTAEQAGSDLANITGAIQGMNNYMQDAGFKGALLNIGEFANMTKEASENTEALSFNVSDYAKRLAKAAANVRLMGATEKEAAKFTQAHGKIYEQKNPFLDMQVGKNMLGTLKREFAKQIQAEDYTGLSQALVSKYKVTETQAAYAASLLLAKKPVPMMENQLAEIFKQSELSRTTIDGVLDDWFKRSGITSMKDVYLAANDPQLLNQLGLDWNNPEDKIQAVNEARNYLARKQSSGQGQAVDVIEGVKNIIGQEDKYQEDAAKKASAETLQKQAPASVRKGIEFTQAAGAHPLLTIPAGLAVLAGVTPFMAKRLLSLQDRFAGKKAAKAAAGEAAESVAEQATKSALSNKGFLGNASKTVLEILARNKKLALVAGGVSAAYAASDLFGSTPEEKVQEEDVNKQKREQAQAGKYTGTLEENVKQAATNTAFDLAGHGAITTAAFLAKKALPEQAAKFAAKKAAGSAMRAVPVLGNLASAGLTYGTTEGSTGRKLFAAAGDLVGGLVGNLVAPTVGGIVGGGVGQLGATQLYDWLNKEDSRGEMKTAGTVSRVRALDTDTTSSVSGTASTSTASKAPQVVGLSTGRFGSVNPDGSVNVDLTARITGFAPAVSQANVQNYARTTQFSGAQK